MTKEEILRIKTHIRIHAARKRGAVIITDILKKAVNELEHTADIEKENTELKNRNQELLKSCEGATMMCKDLCKAKELLNEFLNFESSCMERGIYISDKIRSEAKQLLKEE